MAPNYSVLFINYEYPPYGGGAGKATYYFAAHTPRSFVLTMKGAAPRPDGPLVVEVPPGRRDLSRCSPMKMIQFVAHSIFRIARMPASERPAKIVAFFTIPSGITALAAKLIWNIPYAVWLRGGDVPGFMPDTLNRYHKLLGGLIRFIWRHASVVLSNGPYLRRLAHRFAPGLKVVDVPNGIAPLPYRSRSMERLRCIVASRLVVEQKGIEFLPEVWREITQRFSQLRPTLEIFGDGPAKEYLRKHLTGRNVFFRGWISRNSLIDKLQNAHLFIHLSRYEGISNAALEALACGCVLLIHPSDGNEWLADAPGVITRSDALVWSDFETISRSNHAFSTHFDWQRSANILKKVLLSF